MLTVLPNDKLKDIEPFNVPFTVVKSAPEANLTQIYVDDKEAPKMEVVYKFLGIITTQKQVA